MNNLKNITGNKPFSYKLFAYLNRNCVYVMLPFLLYFFMRRNVELQGGLSTIIIAGFFYIWLLYSVFYFVLYQTEKIAEYAKLKNKTATIKLLFHILAIVFFCSLTFASYYWCIYDFDVRSFENVNGRGFIAQFFDFWFFSLGLFLANNNSAITPETLYAKLFVTTEAITCFFSIVLIFANYRNIQDDFESGQTKRI